MPRLYIYQLRTVAAHAVAWLVVWCGLQWRAWKEILGKACTVTSWGCKRATRLELHLGIRTIVIDYRLDLGLPGASQTDRSRQVHQWPRMHAPGRFHRNCMWMPDGVEGSRRATVYRERLSLSGRCRAAAAAPPCSPLPPHTHPALACRRGGTHSRSPSRSTGRS